MKEFWNQRYQSTEYVYGEAPNAFFKYHIKRMVPGKILEIGAGEGRNAVFAAQRGWHVQAVDYSQTARQKALQLARRQSMHLDYDVADAAQLPYPENSFHVVSMIFVHFDPEMRQKVHKRVVELLKPGGHIVMQFFHKNQIDYKTGGPKNPDMLYTEEILRADFAMLDIKLLKSYETALDEGTHHKGTAFVTDIIATK